MTRRRPGAATPAVRESDVRKAVRDWLRLNGWTVYHNMGGPLSYRGLSDLTAIKGGRVVWIEVKRPQGRQSEEQRKFQADIEAAGGEYLLVRDVDDLLAWQARDREGHA